MNFRFIHITKVFLLALILLNSCLLLVCANDHQVDQVNSITNVTIGPNQYIYDSTLLTYGYYDIKYSSASSSLVAYLVVSTQQGSDPSQNGVKLVTDTLSQYLQQDTINSYYVSLYNSGSTSVILTTFTIEPSYYQLKTDTNTNPSDIPYEGSQITIAPSKTLYFTCYDCLPVIAGTGYARAFIGNSYYSTDPQTVSWSWFY